MLSAYSGGMSTTDFLRDLIRIHSLSGKEGPLAARVLQEWRALGFSEAFTDGAGNALGVVRGQEQGPGWLLVTHLDHVHEGDASLWEFPPFEGALVGDTVHGRGAVDIKGPLAAQTYALGRLLARGVRPRRDVWVAAFTDEEIGGTGADYFVKNAPAQFGGVIVGEPSGSQLMLGHRGVATVRVKFRGRAHHASLALQDENPVFAAAEFIRRVRAHEFPEHPITGRTTLTVTQVFTDSGSENLTPNTVEVVLSWRFNEEDDVNRRTLAGLLSGLPAEGELMPLWSRSNTPGFQTPPTDPLAGLVGRYSGRLREGSGVWKFATDGRYTAAAGWPTVGWGPGDESLAHTTRERVSVRELDAYAEALSELLEKEVPPER